MFSGSKRPCSVGLLACVGAGPGPILRRGDQGSFYWVIFNITNDAIQFLATADAAIVGFVGPKRFPSPSEQYIGLPGGRAFHPSDNPWKWSKWLQHEMNMVRHHNPGEPLVQAVFVLATIKCRGDYARDPGITEPAHSPLFVIQQAVAFGEGPPCICVRKNTKWQRSVQTPGYEQNRLRRIVMRQIPLMIHSKGAGQKACFTDSSVLGGFSRE